MIYDCGERLKELRLKKKLSQTQVARRLGLTRSSISGYENNIAQPSLDILIRLAALYGTTTDYILGVEHHPTIVLDGLTPHQENIVTSLTQNLVTEVKAFNQQFRKEKK